MSETIARADRAKRLIDDAEFQMAFENTRKAILQGFSETPPSKTEQLVKWRERLLLLQSVKENLEQAIRDGKLEAFRIEEQKRPPFLGDLLEWRKKQKS